MIRLANATDGEETSVWDAAERSRRGERTEIADATGTHRIAIRPRCGDLSEYSRRVQAATAWLKADPCATRFYIVGGDSRAVDDAQPRQDAHALTA